MPTSGGGEWQGEDYDEKDIYTVVKAELVGEVDDFGTCEDFAWFKAIFNNVLGNEDKNMVSLTAIVSQTSIVDDNFNTRGFAVPLLRFQKTEGEGEYTRTLNRSSTIARLRADGELKVLVTYTYSDNFEYLDNLSSLADSAIGGGYERRDRCGSTGCIGPSW
ncbi:hypothetical protein shim_25990 [Shimia sp. SK013]|uniref:hypothetical protein n=1 Tax=Shimia sp. SK013 TaxID=1389006 RepID=UPI0006B687BA|nr:hypothetical protein [Shimia sp. SK013]KPA21134.1 hypothetical protein shim_25990 [Shimia sp. SK013]